MPPVYKLKNSALLFNAAPWVPGSTAFKCNRREDGTYIKVTRGWQRISPGDWVYRTPSGDEVVVSATSFRKMFDYYGEIED